MAITYKKLFHMLIDREMTPAQLQKEAGYSANISTRLRRDHYVSLESMEKIPNLQFMLLVLKRPLMKCVLLWKKSLLT